MSNYQKIIKSIKDEKCKECGGAGVKDDAEPGDIGYNTWTCPKCLGTGCKDGRFFAVILSGRLIKNNKTTQAA